EVKTGFTIAAGGATERFGVRPDLVTLAKSLGGGLPSGAIGGTDEAMGVVEDGSVYQVGTFNGNPLSMAAARANLEEVLTPAAYEHLDHINERILAGCSRVIDDHALPGYAIGIAAKVCVTFSAEPVVDYGTFKANQVAIRDGVTLGRRRGDEEPATAVMTDRARAAEPEAGTSCETRQLMRPQRGVGRDDDDAAAARLVATRWRRFDQAADGNAVDAQ